MPEDKGKRILQPKECKNCRGTGKKSTKWIQSPFGLVPVDEKCPFCEDGTSYEEVTVY